MDRFSIKRLALVGVVFIFNGVLVLRTPVVFFRFLFWFFMVSVLIDAVGLAVTRYGMRVTVKRRHPGRVDEGDRIEIEIEIENTGAAPVFNTVIEDCISCAPEAQRIQRAEVDYLPSGYPMVVRWRCACEARGRYALGPCRLYYSDFFGLFTFSKILPDTESQIYVYPRIFRINKFPPMMKGTAPWFGIGASRSSGGDDEFFGVRDYRSGDPVKSIHWISTARRNKLIVREFQQQNFFRATILFNMSGESNLGEGRESVAEYIARIAASVSKHLLDNDIAVEVIAHTQEIVHIPSNKGAEHLEEILKFLTVAQPESNVSLAEIFREFMRFIPDDSNLIVIMLDRDWDVFLTYATAGRRNVSLVPLILLSSSFVTGYERKETLLRAKVKFAEHGDISPLVFSAGEDLERNFSA
ncbi:MAG TPA: DUF58 domain-containing protein [Candidatus Omnitrophota bacterium]|nr:DUF58 domain-containing protein [Candidatus Omnitrophota bacterium]